MKRFRKVKTKKIVKGVRLVGVIVGVMFLILPCLARAEEAKFEDKFEEVKKFNELQKELDKKIVSLLTASPPPTLKDIKRKTERLDSQIRDYIGVCYNVSNKSKDIKRNLHYTKIICGVLGGMEDAIKVTIGGAKNIVDKGGVPDIGSLKDYLNTWKAQAEKLKKETGKGELKDRVDVIEKRLVEGDRLIETIKELPEEAAERSQKLRELKRWLEETKTDIKDAINAGTNILSFFKILNEMCKLDIATQRLAGDIDMECRIFDNICKTIQDPTKGVCKELTNLEKKYDNYYNKEAKKILEETKKEIEKAESYISTAKSRLSQMENSLGKKVNLNDPATRKKIEDILELGQWISYSEMGIRDQKKVLQAIEEEQNQKKFKQEQDIIEFRKEISRIVGEWTEKRRELKIEEANNALKEFTKRKSWLDQLADLVHFLTGKLSEPLFNILNLPQLTGMVIKYQKEPVGKLANWISSMERTHPLGALREIGVIGGRMSLFSPYASLGLYESLVDETILKAERLKAIRKKAKELGWGVVLVRNP
jgi:predicted metal-dependent hydrolase